MAYEKKGFLASKEARPIRLLCDYEEPRRRFGLLGVRHTIAFFGSARTKDSETAAAELLASQQRVDDLRRRMITPVVFPSSDSPDSTDQDQEEEDGEVNEFEPPNSPELLSSLSSQLAEAEVQLARSRICSRMSRFYDAARELSRRLTMWATEDDERNYVICSGGGPGIMEAANRGASEVVGGRSCGLGITLPFEKGVNPYVTRELAFEFHYFFTRKFWFLNLCEALVIFPGGFGTMDELFETLTLIQCKKKKPIPIVLFGEEYWEKVINLEAMAEFGTISPKDLGLIHRSSSVSDAFDYITSEITKGRRD